MPWRDPDTGEEITTYPTEEFRADMERYSRKQCAHERQASRWSANSIGTRHLRMQCLECGRLIGNALSGKTAPEGVPNEDTGLFSHYVTKRRAELRSIYH